MGMVEKVREQWYRWVPGWLPVVIALFGLCMYLQRLSDKVDVLESQMKDVQQYLQTHHAKNDDGEYIPGVSLMQQAPPQDASGGQYVATQ
jgi:hypothetical protein